MSLTSHTCTTIVTVAGRYETSARADFSHATFGYQPTSILSWEDWGGPWEGERTTWANANRQPFNGALVGVSGTSVHNVDTQYPDDAGLTTYIERVSMPMQGHEDVTMMSRIFPQVEGNTPVTIVWVVTTTLVTVPDGSSLCQFDPRADRKVDIRTTGELHAFSVEGPTNGNFNITGLDIEFHREVDDDL